MPLTYGPVDYRCGDHWYHVSDVEPVAKPVSFESYSDDSLIRMIVDFDSLTVTFSNQDKSSVFSFESGTKLRVCCCLDYEGETVTISQRGNAPSRIDDAAKVPNCIDVRSIAPLAELITAQYSKYTSTAEPSDELEDLLVASMGILRTQIVAAADAGVGFDKTLGSTAGTDFLMLMFQMLLNCKSRRNVNSALKVFVSGRGLIRAEDTLSMLETTFGSLWSTAEDRTAPTKPQLAMLKVCLYILYILCV